MFLNVYTYFSDICFKLSLRRTSWKCWDKNVIKVSLYIKSFFMFLIFICIPSFRNLVAMSLVFFHTWLHLISSHYTTFTRFLQCLCLLVCYSYQVVVWWPLPTLFPPTEFIAIFLFWYFRSHLSHLIGSHYFHGVAFLTRILFEIKFQNVRECLCSQVKFPSVKSNRERQNEDLFLSVFKISVTSLFSPCLFSDAPYRQFRSNPLIQTIPNAIF